MDRLYQGIVVGVLACGLLFWSALMPVRAEPGSSEPAAGEQDAGTQEADSGQSNDQPANAPEADEPPTAGEGDANSDEAAAEAPEGSSQAAEAEKPQPAQPAAAEKPAPAPAPRRVRPGMPPRAVPIQGQIQVQVQGGKVQAAFVQTQEADENADASFVQPDRDQLQLLSRARKLLEQKRFSEGIRDLGHILAEDKDGVLPRQPGKDGDPPADTNEPLRFLKAEALRMLGELPQEGREAYELQYGADARRLLDAAVVAGDVSGLEQVARQYFHTRAGYEAMRLLGQHHMDHGRPLAAALCFKRLTDSPQAAQPFEPRLSTQMAACWLWAGLPQQAAQALVDLKHRLPEARLAVGEQQARVAEFGNEAEALAWLTRAVATAHQRGSDTNVWSMYRGDATRNAPSPGGRPLLNHRWRVPTADDEDLLRHVAGLRDANIERDLSAVPAMHPLAVGDVILMRSLDNLLAVDFRTGKRIWEVPIAAEDEVEGQFEPERAAAQPQAQMLLDEVLRQRIWEDATFGTLSSDGQYVYSIEELSLGLGQNAGMGPLIRQQQRGFRAMNGRIRTAGDPNQPHNRLSAYELATEGKLRWSLGGAAEEEGQEEAGTFFLGPPLPLAGRLYVLGESKDEIVLMVIDPRRDPHRGEKLVEWRQPLAVVESNAANSSQRQLSGASPSYSDGVMVCPAAPGVVAAVDLTTRSLLWGYAYPHNTQDNYNRVQMMKANGEGGDEGNTGWIDSSVTLAEGRVLLTPTGSDEVHCLNLLDGKPLWKRPREDGLYLGSIDAGRVLLVGRNSVRALRLADGEPAWDTLKLDLPSGGVPSGRGFLHQGRYYLPLTTAKVVAIDMATGKIVDEAGSRFGHLPGNLVCYRGAIISQGADYVDCFYQTEDLQRQVAQDLATNPDDPTALSLQGEILLDQGQLADAASRLRRSLALDPASPRTRDLLFDALLEGLSRDYAAHRDSVPELESLLSQPEQWDQYLRVAADGLQAAGENLAAFDAYIKLSGLKLDADALGQGEPGLLVRRDRWVQARLSVLRKAAQPEELAKMDELIAARFQQAQTGGKADNWRQFLRFFSGHPTANAAREQLIGLLSERESALEIELLLRRVSESAESTQAASATARLAEMLARMDRPADAAEHYARLALEFSDVVCLDGKTGLEILEGLTADSPVRQALNQQSAFPTGVVKTSRQNQQGVYNRGFTIELVPDERAPRVQNTIEFDQNRQALVGRDGLGRTLWTATLGDMAQQNIFAFQGMGSNRARLNGHLLVVSLGFSAIAIDTLSQGSGAASVLWKQDLSGSLPGVNPFQFGIQQMRVMVPWGGMPKLVMADGSGRPLGALGPLTDEYVCFPRGRALEALDPLTGEKLWVRQGINPNSQFFGDDEVLLVAPPDAGEALVLRAIDGVELGRRTVPPSQDRMATIGRKLLVWTMVNGQSGIKLVDPWAEKEIWSRQFAPGAKAALVGLEAAGVVEPEGHFTLIDLADGKLLIQSDIEQEPSLSEIHLMATRDRYLLIANNPFQPDQKIIHVQPVPGGYDQATIDGHVYGFDRQTGKKIWSAKVEHQGLMLNQPADLPVLVFACYRHKKDAVNNNPVPFASLLCLDKRTGQVIHEEETSNNNFGSYDLEAHPDERRIDLKLPQQTISMTFTEEPLPAAPTNGGNKPAPTHPDDTGGEGDSGPRDEPAPNGAPAESVPQREDVIPQREDVP